jgi:hypothetical protein
MARVNLTKAVFLYIVIYIIVFGASYLYYLHRTEVVIYDTTFIVGDHVGFDLNSSVITFGMVTPGGSSSRGINILESDVARHAKLYARGDVSKFISTSQYSVYVAPESVQEIMLDVNIPVDLSFGNYSGKVKVVLLTD